MASLEAVKDQIKQAGFIGTAGIHGLGIRRAKQAIRVYASADSLELESALTAIRQMASPYEVEVVTEERPNAGSTPPE